MALSPTASFHFPASLAYFPNVYRGFAAVPRGCSGEGLQLRTSQGGNATITDHFFFFPEIKHSQGPLLL